MGGKNIKTDCFIKTDWCFTPTLLGWSTHCWWFQTRLLFSAGRVMEAGWWGSQDLEERARCAAGSVQVPAPRRSPLGCPICIFNFLLYPFNIPESLDIFFPLLTSDLRYNFLPEQNTECSIILLIHWTRPPPLSFILDLIIYADIVTWTQVTTTNWSFTLKCFDKSNVPRCIFSIFAKEDV